MKKLKFDPKNWPKGWYVFLEHNPIRGPYYHRTRAEEVMQDMQIMHPQVYDLFRVDAIS